MDISHILPLLSRTPSVCSSLGMQFLSTSEPDTCAATMTVDSRTRQPFGFLSGGAMLALQESLAGVGSLALCPDVASMGVDVSASHMRPVPDGQTVTATARLLKRGHHLHMWQVDIHNAAGELVSSAHVTNYVSTKPLP